MRTQLIHAQKWARRSRKRMGSVACWERRGRGVTRSQSSASASRARLKLSLLEDETRWGMFFPQRHTVTEMAFRLSAREVLKPLLQSATRHTFDEKGNGVESRPNHDVTLHSVNMGSPTVGERRQPSSNMATEFQYYPNDSGPVMGAATVSKVNRISPTLRISSQQCGRTLNRPGGSGTVSVLGQYKLKGGS